MQIEQLEAFAQHDPDNPQLSLMLAEAYLDAGRVSAAQALLQRASVVDLPRARALRARLLLGTGEYAQARSLLADLCAQEPENAVLWHDLGFAELCLGELSAAQAAVDQALALQVLPEFHLLAARIAHNAEAMDAASAHVATALRLAPTSAQALGLHALVDLDCGRYSDAAAHAYAALALEATQHESLIVLSALALQAQDAAAALHWAGLGLATSPNSPRLRGHRAQALLLGGDL
jgi:predicted Zn-dependent protease